MNIIFSLLVVLVLIAIPMFGATAGTGIIFGVVIPYIAIALFLIGFVLKIINWAKSPVPFKITTTCGQQKTLPWIKHNNLESPSNTTGVILRMALEVFCFRSLFRNTKVELHEGPKLVYGNTRYLWAAGLAFHYSFLVVFLRHFKLFVEPTPGFVKLIESLDGFFQIGLPIIFITDGVLVAAVTYLFLRRIIDNKMRYISLASDYFPLFLILSIATTGILMRYFTKVDLISIKELAVGLFSFQPVVAAGIQPLFFIHLFLVCCLIVYIPFSKLMHMGGVFMSPTRNMSNNNRVVRHVNPWNAPVKTHTYAEWEEEFHDVIKGAGIPLDKED